LLVVRKECHPAAPGPLNFFLKKEIKEMAKKKRSSISPTRSAKPAPTLEEIQAEVNSLLGSSEDIAENDKDSDINNTVTEQPGGLPDQPPVPNENPLPEEQETMDIDKYNADKNITKLLDEYPIEDIHSPVEEIKSPARSPMTPEDVAITNFENKILTKHKKSPSIVSLASSGDVLAVTGVVAEPTPGTTSSFDPFSYFREKFLGEDLPLDKNSDYDWGIIRLGNE
jgi:hypothetical protein